MWPATWDCADFLSYSDNGRGGPPAIPIGDITDSGRRPGEQESVALIALGTWGERRK
jgi:hypothetical protein